MTTITELKKLLFSMILKTPIWLVHLAANQSSVMSIPIGWNFSLQCRPTINLIACAYRLKCSSSPHIKNILKSFIFFVKNEI